MGGNFTGACVIKEKNIANDTDQLTTERGFQIAKALKSVLPRLTPESVSETGKRTQL